MITLNGNLLPYCEGCPNMEIVVTGKTFFGEKLYSCEHFELRNRLFRYLENKLKK